MHSDSISAGNLGKGPIQGVWLTSPSSTMVALWSKKSCTSLMQHRDELSQTVSTLAPFYSGYCHCILRGKVGVGTHFPDLLKHFRNVQSRKCVFQRWWNCYAKYRLVMQKCPPSKHPIARAKLRIVCQPCKPYFSSLCNSHMECRTQDQPLSIWKAEMEEIQSFGL